MKDRACESETAPDSEIDQTRLHVPPVFHSKPADQCSVAGAGPEKKTANNRVSSSDRRREWVGESPGRRQKGAKGSQRERRDKPAWSSG